MPPVRLDVRKLLVWSYNVPVASAWALVSFLPVIGFFQPGATTADLIGEALFLATGLVGLLAAATGLSLLVAPDRREGLPNPLKDRPGVIAVYTTVWLAAYAAFQFGALT